jgi:N-acetylglucosamine-6-sulfatase
MIKRSLTWLCWLVCVLSTQAQTRPNIIFIIVDDLDIRSTRPHYDAVLPTLLRLQRESGIEFTESFVTTPLCCPGRAAILSGRYGHHTNVLNNGGPNGGWENFRDDEPLALPAHLNKAGYRTGIFGKYLNKYQPHGGKLPPAPYGWTDGSLFIDPNLRSYLGYNYRMMRWQQGERVNDSVWQAQRRVEKHGRTPADYSTDVIKGQVLEYLTEAERKDDSQPFFAYIGPTAPHFPLPPAPRHIDSTRRRWPLSSFPTDRPNYYHDRSHYDSVLTDTPADRPKWLRDQWKRRVDLATRGSSYFLRHGAELPLGVQKTGYNQADWFNRMGSLYAVDELLDTLVQWLKAHNEWDNTLIVFSSDNGYNLGAHSLVQKVAPYEEAVRVPLFIVHGPALALRYGVADSSWALNIDLTPTALDAAGIPVPPYMDGKSLLPILKQACEPDAPPFRDRFLVEYHGPGMANGHLLWLKRLHFRWINRWYLDMPSYRALRIRQPVRPDSTKPDSSIHTLMYIEWDIWPELEGFKRRLQNQSPTLLQRIDAGDPKTLEKLGRVQRRDLELYDLTTDPWQLSNLVYYERKRYTPLMQQFSRELKRIEFLPAARPPLSYP